MRQTPGIEHPIADFVARRTSPRAFEPREPSGEELRRLFEAARWSASCFNDQPWHFLVALRSDASGFATLLECLAPANQKWAQGATGLMVVVARPTFERNGRPNAHAWHDCGMALAQLALQATALGLVIHPMAGFDADRVREKCSVPEEYEPVAAVALGYPAPETASSEASPRTRRPQRDFVYGPTWGRSLVVDPEHEWEPLLQFWFGDLDADGRAPEDRSQRWWKADPEFDQELRARFGPLHARVVDGGGSAWSASARGRLAAVIVLDQLSRNLFRGQPEMFASDEEALRLALEGIERGHDRALLLDERSFLYMPLMHSESLAMQDRCIELFRSLRSEVPEALFDAVDHQLGFAQRHRDIVAQWGRFPHRNAVLGRESSAEELRFLQTPGSSF